MQISVLSSLGILLLCALLLGGICKLIKLPPLLGMLVTGIILGPYVADVIAGDLLDISSDLRTLALIIILTRAGLSLDVGKLRKNGRSAVMLCFVPATAEIIGYVILGVTMLSLTAAESALLGCVMAAVSPAVVVPRMLKIQASGYGEDKGISQMITAGASADDIFVIILFTALTSAVSGGGFDASVLWQIPVSVLLGITLGLVTGYALTLFFARFHRRDSIKVVLMLALSCLMMALQYAAEDVVPISGLLGVITMAAVIFRRAPQRATRLCSKYDKLWVGAEIILFVLVGAQVNIDYVAKSGGLLVAVILIALIFRMAGVALCFVRTPLNARERLFCMAAYSPKATVQAAIGGIPLAMGLACGDTILSAAVLAIIITAPAGAFLIDMTYKKLLSPPRAALSASDDGNLSGAENPDTSENPQ